MRDLQQVMKRIIVCIPEDEKIIEYKELIRTLNYILRLYRAPEMNYNPWDAISIELDCFLGYPDTEWKQQIQRIFAGTDTEKSLYTGCEIYEEEC